MALPFQEMCIDGNGLRYWKSFWIRRQFNPKCTNLEELRPRLLFISDSEDLRLSGVYLKNSPYWTTHLYHCRNMQLLNLHIFAPHSPVKAPSNDAIDIDVCINVLIKNCYMSVNDDAVSLKGGKGPWADQDKENNGNNCNIIIEDCTYGFCHSTLTCGSESIHNLNIILRRCTIEKAQRLLWLKMRPNTPQCYEHILVKDITGFVGSILYTQPWTQFFDLKGRKDIPLSFAKNVTMQNIRMICEVTFDVLKDESQYQLSDFVFKNWEVIAEKKPQIHTNYINKLRLENINIKSKWQV